jgi:hypothetical protein
MKALLIGAAFAAAAGMTMGAAFHPDLITDERPEGPQMFSVAGGPRSTGPFDSGMSLASYGPNVPDYVIGTDAKRRVGWSEEPARLEESQAVAQVEPAPEPVTFTKAAYEDLPPPEPYYPSVAGGQERDLPAEDAGELIVVG